MFGDLATLLDSTLLFGIILLIGSISGYMSEKVGIVNIGIDGMMCMGALFFGIFSSDAVGLANLGFGAIFIAFVLTMIATTFIGAMHAFVCINLKTNHIISGTAINLVGAALAAFLNEPLANSLFPGRGFSRINCGFQPTWHIANGLQGSSVLIFAIGILICVAIWVIMSKTKIGLRYRAVGENPNAVDTQGISVFKYQWIGVLISGALAGLAGAIYLFRINAFTGSVQSMGYLALAILITGGWKIPWIGVFSLIFAVLNAGANSSTFTRIGLDPSFVFSLPYIITLGVLLFSSKSIFPPAHSGIPFSKEKR